LTGYDFTTTRYPFTAEEKQNKRLEKKLSDGQMKMGRIEELIKKYIVHGHTLL
jgi:hypothetical protein